MTIYHAGTEIVQFPLVKCGRKNLDFGRGFYTTDLLAQAMSWAERIALKRGLLPIVNKYEIDIVFVKESFRYLKFTAYDRKWLDFIVSNRRGGNQWQQYDIIEGGIADDRVVDTVELFIGGYIPGDLAIDRLRHFAPNNQICITNQHVIDNYMKFIGIHKL